MNDVESLKDFLREHPRYWTMNSWNRSSSYSNCVKVHHLPLTREQLDTAFELVGLDEFYDTIHDRILDWESDQNHRWKIGFNGRSSGYLVLYKSYKDDKGRTVTYPGRGFDDDPDMDFDGWELVDFQDRAKDVLAFDLLCDELLAELIYMCDEYDVVEETIMVPKKVKVLKEKKIPEGPPPYDSATATGMYDHD